MMRFGENLCLCQMFSCDSQAGDLSGLTINDEVLRIWDFWIWTSKIMKNIELSGKVIVGSLGLVKVQVDNNYHFCRTDLSGVAA